MGMDVNLCVCVCRYFLLDPEGGQLQYFVSEQGRSQKPRGSLPLIGASVTASDEAPHMFIVSSANGELFKLRGILHSRSWLSGQCVRGRWAKGYSFHAAVLGCYHGSLCNHSVFFCLQCWRLLYWECRWHSVCFSACPAIWRKTGN